MPDMPETYKLLFAKGYNEVFLPSRMANRHGLIAGATGTGKTASLKVLAEKIITY
jgi:Cdc6-like AAA superfamily ATPase